MQTFIKFRWLYILLLLQVFNPGINLYSQEDSSSAETPDTHNSDNWLRNRQTLQSSLSEINQETAPPAPGGFQEGVTGSTTPLVPMDGGLGFLLAAGLGYGSMKLRKHVKEKVKAD